MPVTSPRASVIGFPVAPEEAAPDQVRRIAEVANGLLQGKLNTVSTLTLTAAAASTTLSDPRIGPNTGVLLIPTTANASAEIGNGTIYQTYPNAANEAAVINHANNAQADRTFITVLLG